jgi:hypothetical protein
MHWTDKPNPEFDQWWATKTAAGYQYGREALENVRFGFEGAQSMRWHSPPVRVFTSGKGWSQKQYVLTVDAKGRMAVAYFERSSTGELNHVSAKPTGAPTHWMFLPDPPSLEEVNNGR